MAREREQSGAQQQEATDHEDPPPEFIDQVMTMVEGIPPGRVMTYGDIATILTLVAGHPLDRPSPEVPPGAGVAVLPAGEYSADRG